MIARWMLACATASTVAWFAWPSARIEAAQVAPTAVRAERAAPIGERCRACHPDLVRSYRETGMARTLGPIEAGELAGLASVPDAQTGFSYAFDAAGERARIVETWSPPSADAKTSTTSAASQREAFPLAFAIGAGLVDRSYVALNGELMWLAPLEVLTSAAGRRATLSPGHAIQPETRLTIPIAEECLSCHTDALPARDYPLNLRPDEARWQPRGIDCGACHLRAQQHAVWREQDLAGLPQSGGDPLVVSARGDALASMSSCARCHLQGDARVALHAGERGVPPPSRDLLEQRAIFVAAEQTAEIGFVSQVERLVRSRCYLDSPADGAGALTCTTCHDPHRSSFDPAERALVRSKCLACHTAGEGGEAPIAGAGHAARASACTLALSERGDRDCVSCHMRRTGVFDVAAVEIHDHFIERKPPKPSTPGKLRIKEALDGKLAVFAWPKREAPAYAQDPGLWMIALASARRPELALPFAERAPGPIADALPMYHHVRASLFEFKERFEEARRSYERALALDPAQAESTVNLALVSARLGQPGHPDEGLRMLDRLLAVHPRAEGALRNRAILRSMATDLDGAVRDLELAFAISPRGVVAHLLQTMHSVLGDAERAAQWAARAHHLDPARY